MKICLHCIFAIALFLSGVVHAYSTDTFVDDMEKPSSEKHIHYKNFRLPPFPSSLGEDKSYFILSQKGFPASVTYHVNGVSSMTISVYSQTGTFITKLGSQLNLGGNPSNFVSRALFDSEKQMIYTNTEQGNLIYTSTGQGVIGTFSAPPFDFSPSPLLYYGVNVQISTDGQQFTSLTPTLYSVSIPKENQQHYYETYTVSVPPGASYLKVMLYDISSVPDSSFNHDPYPIMTPLHLCLASVKLEGTNLFWGNLPPKPEPEPSPNPDPLPPPSPELPPDPNPPFNPDDHITEEDLAKPPAPENPAPSKPSDGSHSKPPKSSKPSLGKGVHTSVGSFQKETIPGIIKAPSNTNKITGSKRRYSSAPSAPPKIENTSSPNTSPSSVAVNPDIPSPQESYRKTVSFSSGLYLAGISLCITLLVIRSNNGDASS